MISSVLAQKIEHIQVKPDLRDVLRGMLAEIERSREQAVTKTDFNELKEIVRDLATAQQRTEQRVEELATAQKEMAAAQQEMMVAQQEMAREVATLARAMKDTRNQVGGLGRSMAYALENEAYRKLPQYLRTHHQIEVAEKFVRTEIGGEEVNFFAKARQNGADVVIVGESVLKLDDRGKLKQLSKQVAAAQEVYQLPALPLVVTHYARPKLLEKLEREGMLVVQSFAWE